MKIKVPLTDDYAITADRLREKAKEANEDRPAMWRSHYFKEVISLCRDKANHGAFEVIYIPKQLEARNTVRGEAIESVLKHMQDELGFKVNIEWRPSYNARKVCVLQAYISWE